MRGQTSLFTSTPALTAGTRWSSTRSRADSGAQRRGRRACLSRGAATSSWCSWSCLSTSRSGPSLQPSLHSIPFPAPPIPAAPLHAAPPYSPPSLQPLPSIQLPIMQPPPCSPLTVSLPTPCSPPSLQLLPAVLPPSLTPCSPLTLSSLLSTLLME